MNLKFVWVMSEQLLESVHASSGKLGGRTTIGRTRDGGMDKVERINRYGDTYLEDDGFEAVCVRFRQRKVIQVLIAAGAETVVEAGCGADLLFNAALASGLKIKTWVTVEPSQALADIARSRARGDDRLIVIQGFFEDALEKTRAAAGGTADAVVLAGLINEVAEPELLLATARSLMGDASLLHVNTANAFSLHRRLGRCMGLVTDLHELTERNRRFDQFRVFDPESLAAMVTEAGFAIEETGGYFLKPFTHDQMEQAATILTPEVLDALYRLGEELPELALERFINARRTG